MAAHPRAGGAETISRLSSRFLARGEQALLEIAVTGVQPTAFPDDPGGAGRGDPPGSARVPSRSRSRGADWSMSSNTCVSSYDTGIHVLPAFEVMAGGIESPHRAARIHGLQPGRTPMVGSRGGRHPFPLRQRLPRHEPAPVRGGNHAGRNQDLRAARSVRR